MEMEQLLSMGFPNELAAQALAATGGKSTLKATEWILHHHKPTSSSTTPSSNPTNPNPNPNSSPSSSGRPFQPKLDRFFHFHSKPSSIDSPPSPTPTSSTPPPPPPHPIEDDDVSAPSPPLSKRPKLPIPPSKSANKPFNSHQLLSERMRPRTLDDVVGQDHLLGPNSLLRSAIESDRLPSIVLWGPPGTGKTSIARAILNSSPKPSSYRFVSLSAVTCGVKDVREVVDEARKARNNNGNGFGNKGKRTVLFLDEVHRFNKSQQDSFLPIIEDGSIVFMGATTENPSFHLITPLLSRCRVLVLHPLKPHHLALLLRRAVDDSVDGLNGSVGIPVRVDEEAVEFISSNCDGDARVALNALEISATTAAARVSREAASTQSESEKLAVAVVNVEDAKEALQCKHLAYDKAGEEHYNLISALHKSMRGSDGDAAIYWLARMLEGGEEPLYVARRLIRFASEDVGLADPLALNQAVACYQACHFLGMPECNVILAQCVAYLALAPKSISVYQAIEAAQKVVRDSVGQNEGVPLHLRNAPTKLMKEIGYGKGYIYPPDNPDATQSYLPLSLQGFKFLDWPKSDGSNR